MPRIPYMCIVFLVVNAIWQTHKNCIRIPLYRMTYSTLVHSHTEYRRYSIYVYMYARVCMCLCICHMHAHIIYRCMTFQCYIVPMILARFQRSVLPDVFQLFSPRVGVVSIALKLKRFSYLSTVCVCVCIGDDRIKIVNDIECMSLCWICCCSMNRGQQTEKWRKKNVDDNHILFDSIKCVEHISSIYTCEHLDITMQKKKSINYLNIPTTRTSEVMIECTKNRTVCMTIVQITDINSPPSRLNVLFFWWRLNSAHSINQQHIEQCNCSFKLHEIQMFEHVVIRDNRLDLHSCKTNSS